MVNASYIRRWPSPVAHVRQGLKPVQVLSTGRYLYLLSVETNGDGFFYLNLYATQGVYYVFDPVEVNDDVVVYGESGKVFEGLYHEVWATVGESGVYFVLPVARDLYQGIPRNRQNSFAGLCHQDCI